MTIAAIRSLFERTINSAYQALATPVPVYFDNVQEDPLFGSDAEYVVLSVSFPSITTGVICMEASAMDRINGSVQISCYGPRGQGMKRLEELSSVGSQALQTIKTAGDATVRASVGAVDGPTQVPGGDAPYCLTVISAPFNALVN